MLFYRLSGAVLVAAVLTHISNSQVLAQCTEAHNLTASDGADGERYGQSVSMDGDTVVVSASRYSCPEGFYCGAAYVHQFNGSSWIETKLTASVQNPDDEYGRAVSVSGNTVIVGSRDYCPGLPSCGAVYVNRFNGTSWLEEQKLINPGPRASDGFGFSVSVSGDKILVGAPSTDCGTSILCGAAYVYRYDGNSWVLEQKLTASDASLFDQFGYDVALDGDTAVVGAHHNDCTPDIGNNCGSAYVFRFDGTTWSQQQKLTASDGIEGDWFGASVSASGDTVVVGAQLKDCAAGTSCGAAYAYDFNGSSWIEQRLTPSDEAFANGYGIDVSVSGDMAVIGAINGRCPDVQCGSANVFRKIGGSWVETQILSASDQQRNDQFGLSVSVDVDKIVIGTPSDRCTDGRCGSVYVFESCPNCGNGILDSFEECDHAGQSMTCDADCTLAECGDSTINVAAGEECEGGNRCFDCQCRTGFEPTVPVSFDCQLICSNGVLDPGETCDDGNTLSDDGCSGNCQIELGACCTGTMCSEMTEISCTSISGIFFGLNSTCNSPDADGDGLRNECDACRFDSNKVEPGICGCGKDDNADSDNDGVLDCDDECHGVDDSIFSPQCVGAIPAVSEWGLVVMTLLLLIGIKLIGLNKQQQY